VFWKLQFCQNTCEILLKSGWLSVLAGAYKHLWAPGISCYMNFNIGWLAKINFLYTIIGSYILYFPCMQKGNIATGIAN